MISVSSKDKQVLRALGTKLAEISALPIQQRRIGEWKRHNSLKAGKPLVFVWAAESPWHELDVNDELKLQTSDKFCQSIETNLRRLLYQWNHFQGDMIIESHLECWPDVRDTGIGIQLETDKVIFDKNNPVTSRHFNPVIKEPEDIEKIKMPVVTYDQKVSQERLETMQDIFAGIMPVTLGGIRGSWFAAIDTLIEIWGIQEFLMDLVVRPDMVHAGMERILQWYLSRTQQHEDLGLYRLNNGPQIVGTGGYGCIDELPQKDFNANHVRTIDSWGASAAQMFATVSPEMHYEFATQYEMRYLKRFGLNWYGCCDPLHHKIDIIKKLPNLRKISMSPWADPEIGAASIGNNYVFSFKPNPAVVAESSWDPSEARRQIRHVLEITKKHGCVVEIIMKDISTVCYEPKRLWEWEKIASEEAERIS
jgi:hypothetical protein